MRIQQWSIVPALIVLAIALGSFTTAGAQEAASSDAGKNSLRDGKSALIYEIVGDFDLTAFEGANLSYKHHYTDNRAYRIGLSVSLSSDNRDDDAPGYRWVEQNRRLYSARLTVLKLHYQRTTERGCFYWGIGPRLGYSRDRQSRETPMWDDDVDRRTTIRQADASLLVVAGVEWFASHQLSLLAQYGTAAGYSWRNIKTEERRATQNYVLDNSTEDSGWSLGADAVRFALSLYW